MEMNNLEDAYINIAKEEEKLLKELEQNGVRTQSQQIQHRSSINENDSSVIN